MHLFGKINFNCITFKNKNLEMGPQVYYLTLNFLLIYLFFFQISNLQTDNKNILLFHRIL
jgi:hypothetical protein